MMTEGLEVGNARAKTQVLDRALGPISKILQQYLGIPVFFLTFHSRLWALRCYTGDHAGDPKEAGCLDEILQKYPNPNRDLEQLDALALWLSENANDIPPERLFQSARSLMAANELPLGWTVGADSRESGLNDGHGPSHWTLELPGPAPLRRFQEALDYAFVHKFEVTSLTPDQRSSLVAHDYVIEVPHYMKVDRLVDATSFRTYFAEYVYSQSGKVSRRDRSRQPKPDDPSQLDHFFLPLRGLGQWRAAACWVSSHRAWKASGKKIDPGFHSALQSIYSQVLIDSFATHLNLALIRRFDHRLAKQDTVFDAFASLWWASEIAWFRNETLVTRMVRCRKTGALEPSEDLGTALRLSVAEVFLSIHESPASASVQLDLRRLPDFEEQAAEAIFGFDSIVFAVPLFAMEDAELTRTVYSERIAEQLASSLRLYTLQQRATRGQTVEAVGHSMNATMLITGWKAALQGLQQMSAPRAPEVEEAIRSLSLNAVVSGSSGLLRLVGLCSQGDYGKLGDWTSRKALKNWRKGGPELLERYTAFIRYFVATLCYGMEWRSGFYLRVTGGHESADQLVETDRPPSGSVDAWLMETALPPLLLTMGPAPHIALLGALIEPVHNAIDSLKKQSQRGPVGQLHLQMGIASPGEPVRVEIGNDVAEPPPSMPPGLQKTMELLRITHLASIEEIRDRRDGRYWVRVDLHPDRLAERILEALEDRNGGAA